MILKPNDPRFGATTDVYVSPFPDEGSLADPKFVASLRAIGNASSSGEGLLAQYQAQAWDETQRVLTRKAWTSPFAGGIRSDWLDRVAVVAKGTKHGSEVVQGLFAKPPFPISSSAEAMGNAAAQVGLVAAQAVLTSVSVVGPILKAAIGVGRFFWRLANQSEDERELEVPWQEFSRETDADAVNKVLATYALGTDWTQLFMPAVDWKAGGWSLEKTDKGDNTRAFGVFSPSGDPRYAGGIGMMPGTQQIADVVQVAQVWQGTGGKRRDAVTNVGAFWPSVSQYATGAWQACSRSANPDMYKVRAGDLADAWTSFFDSLFEDAFDRYGSLGVNDWTQKIFLSKALAPYVVAVQGSFNQLGLNVGELDGPYVTPEIFSDDFVGLSKQTHYERPDAFYIRPACREVKRRQKSALARTLVCALVRPRDIGNLPAFAAFNDSSEPLSPGYSTFGEELRDYCDEMRALLLKHPDRYKLAKVKPGSVTFDNRYAPDVLDVDPQYAAELEKSFTSTGLDFKMKDPLGLAVEPLEPNAPTPGPDQAPGGGPPFPVPPDSDGWWRRHWPIVATLTGIAGAAGVAKWRKW